MIYKNKLLFSDSVMYNKIVKREISMYLSSNIIIIIVAFAIAAIAIYVLYSIILFQGSGKGDDLQLSTKNILEQVDVLFSKGEFPLVILLGTKYLDRVPGHTDVRVYVARAYYEDRKYNQAIKHAQIVLKKRPNSVETHRVLGDCYIKKQMYMKAIREYEFLYDHDKTDKNVIRTLAELYRETDQQYMAIGAYGFLVEQLTSDDEIADIQSIIAELNIEAHDYPAAFEAYKSRLGIYPKDVQTNRKLAELYIKIGNHQVAIETLMYMLSFVTEPKELQWIYSTLIDLYEETEDYEHAIEYAEKLMEVQGSDKFKLRDRIASFNIKLGRLDDGITILEDLAMMSQNNFDITTELADAYIQHKEYQKALDRYTLLLDKAVPKEAKQINLLICDLYITWALNMRDEGKFDESYEFLKSATSYNAINSEIYYNIAYNDFLRKDYSGTIDSIAKAIEYDKNEENIVKYLLLLADAHHNVGNFFEEKKALSDLLNIDEKNAEGLLREGMIYFAQHDIKNAEETLKKAIMYAPDMIQAKYNLAMIYENNNKDKAKELYMEVLEQDPAHAEAKRALNELSTGDAI